MGLSAAFYRDDGTRDEPGPESWNDWVSASRTRNFCADDPLIDWLDTYGREHGFTPDNERPGYDERTDFRRFLLPRAQQFEDAVVRQLGTIHQLVRIRNDYRDVFSRSAVEATWEAMATGVEIIAQGVLWNPETKTYGSPDLIVRSDILHRLFQQDLSEQQARVSAPDLPAAAAHYRVVDVKFTSLNLQKDGHAAASHWGYMVQVWLYNEALGRMQGFTPSAAYLLGRRWKSGKTRGASALERLARVDRGYAPRGAGSSLAVVAQQACDWVRRVRTHGPSWQVLPQPMVDELRPNVRRSEDQPWHLAKREIAEQVEDLTILYRVGPDARTTALGSGLGRWTDQRVSAAALGITGDKIPALVDAIIHANHSNPAGPAVFPAKVTVQQVEWREPVRPEFYVDFETVSDLDDDFSRFPEVGGSPLVFMIGCGYYAATATGPRWTFQVFTVRALSLSEERWIIEAWLAYMRRVCHDHGTVLERARLFHWSPAEASSLTEAYNSARTRQGNPDWPELPWCDLLNGVVKAQPITVRGAFGFGLKAIAKALHRHGLIETLWGDGPTDGLGAMVGAWWCHHEALRTGGEMHDLDLMKQIAAYNEVDCRVMAEALNYLRAHH